uniref:Uncharacterized protein n=1 Tax=Cajanus cajan TaxID=3821 RepID=A0A151SG55_CAJCA|nr:hypothetical protein KK1_024360 [Cajanus cajan]
MTLVMRKSIKVDNNTLKVVEIDLTHTMVSKVYLNGYWHKVEYERFHIICIRFGCHLTRNCAMKKTTTTLTVVHH